MIKKIVFALAAMTMGKATGYVAGTYTVRWDAPDHTGRGLATGVYFCRFQAGTTFLQIPVVLIR